MKTGARFLDICYGLSVLAQVAQRLFLGSRPQGSCISLNLIILLDLRYDSGQNEIFFLKIETRVQFR